jgi:hypothetical protein
MCRALYAFKNGEQVSKKQAALWAQKELPQWSPLITAALSWREAYRDEGVDHASTLPERLFSKVVVGYNYRYESYEDTKAIPYRPERQRMG